MQKKLYSKILALTAFLTMPFTLHSTDIYHSSHGEVKIIKNLNSYIIPGDSRLGSTIIIATVPKEKKGVYVVTSCEHKQSLLYKQTTEKNTVYIFQLNFPTSCNVPNISIGDEEYVFTDTTTTLPMISNSLIETKLVNTDDDTLLKILRKPLSLSQAKKNDSINDKLSYLTSLYVNIYEKIESDKARDVLLDRDQLKYISPVIGYKLPSNGTLIPGANRGYRQDTTDGTHHGWDIMAPYGTPVQALAKGKIIRIKNNWSWNDFYIMKKGNITPDDKLANLDVFRGNQVWLQTMDGNVTFYSHLSKISENITPGSYVDIGTYLGNIGISGVPDKNYKNIHLHFEIQQNPFNENIKNPSYLDIMRWDYVGKGLNKQEIYEKMKAIFE